MAELSVNDLKLKILCTLKGPCTRFEMEHMLNNYPYCIQKS